jgi:monoamine oxidase
MLRRLTLRAPFSPGQRHFMEGMGFSTNSKLLLGMKLRLWRDTGRSGYTYSDEPFQCFWDNTSFLDSAEYGLTVFAGGRAGQEIGRGSPEDQTRRLLPSIDKVFPGQAAQCSGVFLRRHWPDEPFILGGYATWPPGSWTEMEHLRPQRPVGNLYFAGEHTSPEHQGFMNGAAESGRVAAEHILERLGLPSGGSPTRIAPPGVF